MSKDKETPANLRASPMTYEVIRARSLSHDRDTLATEAESLSVDELKSRAESAQFDLSGAKTKAEMVSAVQSQARGVEPTPENG